MYFQWNTKYHFDTYFYIYEYKRKHLERWKFGDRGDILYRLNNLEWDFLFLFAFSTCEVRLYTFVLSMLSNKLYCGKNIKVSWSMLLGIEAAETKSRWSDAQLNWQPTNQTNTIHQLSISLNKGEQQLLQTKLKISRSSWNIPVSQSGERFWSGVQTIYCMGVLMLFQGPRLGKLVSFT